MAGPLGDHDAQTSPAFLIDKALQSDASYLDLSDLLQIPKHNLPTVSGRMDFDYPSLTDSKMCLSSMKEIGHVKHVPLPDELSEQYRRMQCKCMMGLLPEISRAWLTIDSDIFVWNYEDRSDLAYFDGLNESILSVGLLTPKPGVFQPHIQHLLCMTTPIDIVLLGVSFAKPQQNFATSFAEMHLLPEPLFSIPTDGVHMKSIAGTGSGRIFLGGRDGCLYEVVYQAEDGWFSRKCKKVNHSTSKLSYVLPSFLNFSFIDDDAIVELVADDSRNVLYARSEQGSVQVFDLGADGKSLSKVAVISHQTIVNNATLLAKGVDRSNLSPIVSISAVPRNESANIHLVAVTQSGVRMYFTTCAFGLGVSRPCMLSMVHIRLPPGFAMSVAVQKPTNVMRALHNKGTLLLSSKQSDDAEMLWLMSPDSFPFQKLLRETFETVGLNGNTWAMAEIPTRSGKSADVALNRAEPPAVVTQHVEGSRKFVLLNPNESYIVTKLSPVEQLTQLLQQQGPDSEDVKSYFQLHKEQACATCLVLACSQQIVMKPIAEAATRAFFVHGGDPEHSLASGPIATLGPGMASPHGGSFLSSPQFSTPAHGLQPIQMSTPYQQSIFQNNSFTSDIVYSSKHSGICMYFARILRAFWDRAVVSELKSADKKKTYFVSAFSTDEVSFALSRLLDLRDFLQRHSQFTSPLVAESLQVAQTQMGRPFGRLDAADDQLRRKCQAEAEAAESASMRALTDLVVRASESLALWSVLTEHQFHVVVGALNTEQQRTLANMTFKNFVTTGRETAGVLITALVNLYVDDNAATDAISERLREVCPSLYSVEDAVCSKANEKLQTARTAKGAAERAAQLRESLALFKQVAPHLDMSVVCNQFVQARFFSGVVDLALTAAAKRDPQKLALHFYKNGQPPEDTQGCHFFSGRMDCYKCITESLDFLLATNASHPQSTSVPKSPGPPPAKDESRLTTAEADHYAEEVYSLALKSDDEMFHIALYDWLVSKQLFDKLLDIQSPFLEPYLKQAATQYPDRLSVLDLLWKHYEKTKNYASAARILAKLADRAGNDLTLTQRIEYLSRAAMCAKSCTMSGAGLLPGGSGGGNFLHEIEEKLDVAQLQLQLMDTISRLPLTDDSQRAVEALDRALFDISELYGEFASRFALPECQLAIVHSAGHYELTLIETLWRNIIDQELAGGDARATVRAVSNKLVTLGRVYAASDRFFPLPFLVRYLEQRSCELSLDRVELTFVVTSLTQVGVTLPRLLEIYDRLHAAKDACWRNMRRTFHLVTVIHRLLDMFASNVTTVAAFERRHFTSVALDVVARLLVELQAESGYDPLIAAFKDLQAKLERL